MFRSTRSSRISSYQVMQKFQWKMVVVVEKFIDSVSVVLIAVGKVGSQRWHHLTAAMFIVSDNNRHHW